MEEIFKRNLLSMRQPTGPKTFSEALLGASAWTSSHQRIPARGSQKPIQAESFSEKKQVIESLERFAMEQAAQTQNNVIKIDGGELSLRPDPTWDNVPAHASINDLLASLTLAQESLQVIFKNKRPGAIKVMFVTETFRKWEEVQPELKGSFVDELLVGFSLKTAELFERMITAMKLSAEEVLIYPIEEGSIDLSSEVMSIARSFKPEVIVTLGALATNKILKGNDRLSLIHGQFFNRRVDETDNFQIVPLFHPSIIETNQNMKKTAWSDMQKIMKHLKKLP